VIEKLGKGKKRRILRLLVRCCALVIAVILVLPILPWSWTPLVLPSLSPYVLICSAVATRVIGLVALLGLPVLVIVLVRRRWFCRYACPVGLLAEYTGRLRRKKGTGPICAKHPPGRSGKLDLSPFSVVRRLPPIGRWVALLTLGGALFGYPFFLWLDPLAIFHGVFTLAHDPPSLAGQVSAVVLGVIMSISLLLPGAWCTRLCPLGATQDLLALPQRLFRRKTSPTDEAPADGTWLPSRRSVLSAGVGAVCLCGGFRWATASSAPSAGRGRRLLRPPGSIDETRLVGACIRGGNCIRACPEEIVQPDAGNAGIAGFLAPKVSFDEKYCREDCNRCTQICPSGAIAQLTLEEKNKAPIGLARLEAPLCLLWDDGECDLCEKVCPFGAISIDWNPEEYVALPVVHKDKCPGCGVCQLMCPGTNDWERENSDEPIPVRKAIEIVPS